MYMQSWWMGGSPWLALLMMLSASMLFLALLFAGVWLFSRWAGRDAARMDIAARRMEQARDDLLRARDAVSATSTLDAHALPANGQQAISQRVDGAKRL